MSVCTGYFFIEPHVHLYTHRVQRYKIQQHEFIVYSSIQQHGHTALSSRHLVRSFPRGSCNFGAGTCLPNQAQSVLLVTD